jgi:hypothetical protein
MIQNRNNPPLPGATPVMQDRAYWGERPVPSHPTNESPQSPSRARGDSAQAGTGVVQPADTTAATGRR